MVAYDHKRNQDLTSLRAEKEDRSKLEQTFDVKISSVFTTARDDLERTARETHAYADKMLGFLGQLEELHLHKQTGFQIVQGNSRMNKAKFDGLLSTYSLLLNELAPWRKQVIRAGDDASQTQFAHMRKSRKDIVSAAKRRLDEAREKQQLATDASELMKQYKALIMAV